MTPLPELLRLAGQTHHIPDSYDLRVMGDHGTPCRPHPAAAEVYTALPDILVTAIDGTRARDEIRTALNLPASTPLEAVLARCRHLAACDPARTLDEEDEASDEADDIRDVLLRQTRRLASAVGLDGEVRELGEVVDEAIRLLAAGGGSHE